MTSESRGHRTLLLLSTATILILVVPWTTFDPHSHWWRVGWMPFANQGSRSRLDMVLNTLLYIPFGYFMAKSRPGHGWWRVAAYACALSIGTELTQVFSNVRYPTTTDVICNSAGATWGAVWALARPKAGRTLGVTD